MRIARRFAVVVAALFICTLASVASAQGLTLGGASTPDAVSLIYDPATGNLSMDSGSVSVTTLEVKSAGSMFDAAKANETGQFVPPFDVASAAKLFRLTTNGVNSLNFGDGVLPTGLSADALLADLSVNGSIKPSGGLGNAPGGGPYLYVVPEPSSILLAACGLLGVLGLRRK